MNLIDLSNFRYSTKSFDPNKKISDADIEQIKYLLQYAPSSTNLQPWHFVIASTEEGKKRVAKGTQEPFHFNQDKVLNASHVIIFATIKEATDAHLINVLEKEDKDGRYVDADAKAGMDGGRKYFLGLNKQSQGEKAWHEKQTYLNMGSLLLGVAALGIDAVAMEGVDIDILNEEFGFTEKGMTALAVVSLGYRADDDFNAKLPKSRLSQEEIFTLV